MLQFTYKGYCIMTLWPNQQNYSATSGGLQKCCMKPLQSLFSLVFQCPCYSQFVASPLATCMSHSHPSCSLACFASFSMDFRETTRNLELSCMSVLKTKWHKIIAEHNNAKPKQYKLLLTLEQMKPLLPIAKYNMKT